MSKTIHHEVVFSASPRRVYEALMTTEQHGSFTGGEANISPDVGGAFSCHDGQITGRNVELVENETIVQAWRVAAWDAGLYSIVKLQLSAEGEGTRLVLDHSGVPDGMRDAIDAGWHARYWGPLATFLS